MSKRPYEEFDWCNNIVIVPKVALPAKKPKLDSIPAPPLPPEDETVELADIPVPPPPLPRSDPQTTPLYIKLMCDSGKIAIKTEVLSEKPIKPTVSSTATSNTQDATVEKASGSEGKKYEMDQSKLPQCRSWASDYLMSIGHFKRKPIKLNLSTRRNPVSTKESPPKDEANISAINAGEKNTDVEIKKTKLLVKHQPAKDKLQTSKHTESNLTKYATKKPENISANILDVPTVSSDHFLTNRNTTLDPLEQVTAEKYQTLQAPLNSNHIVYYNYNISNNFIPHMHTPHMNHDIDYYNYSTHHNYNFENPIHEHYQTNHAYQSYYEQGRVANDRSYLDVKIDEFLAKVSQDNPRANRFDKTKTGEIMHTKSLSLKRHATEPRRETYQNYRYDLHKKSRISEERKKNDINKPGTKDYNISKKYKDFTQNARISNVSSKKFLGTAHEECEIKMNTKNDKIREHSKDYCAYKKYKTTEKEDSTKEKSENNTRGRRSQSSERSNDTSSQSSSSSKEQKRNKYKRANEHKGKSSSTDKYKLSSYVSRRSEEHEQNKIKTELIDKERTSKTKKTSSASNSYRGSEEYNTPQTKREDREKTSNDNEKTSNDKQKTSNRKDKTSSQSTRRSEEIEHKSKTKQDKERSPSKDKYTVLKETIRQKVKKAKDDINRLRRQREKTPDEENYNNLHNNKSSTSKQARYCNYEKTSSEKSMKSIVQVNNDPKLDINEPFDLRSKLSRQNLNQYINKIRKKSSSISEKALESRENLVITVANNCDETETVDKPTEKPEKTGKKNKKVKKIQLVINVVCEESDTSESEDNTASTEIKKSSSLSAEDLSFLDDLNIDEIVNSLTSTHKEFDVSKICANNEITTNIEDHIISDDESDASTVHLEQVDQMHDFDNNDQLNRTDNEEKEHQNMLRNLVNNNVPLSEQRSKEKKDDCNESLEHEIHKKDCEPTKIKEEMSDKTNCTQVNRRIKETDNTSTETTSSTTVDEKALFKKLFTPMMEIKIEPIEILSDDETPTNYNLGNCKLGANTLNTRKRDSTKISEIQVKESVTKVSKTIQTKTEPIKALNAVSPPPPVPDIPMTIKSECAEIDKNTVPTKNVSERKNNTSASSTPNEIMHSLVEIKEEPKEIAETFIAPLNTSEKTTKVSTSIINILEDNTMPQSEIKIEPMEIISNEEGSLENNTKENCIETMQSKKAVSTGVKYSLKIVQETDASTNNGRGDSEYSNETKTSNSKTTNRNSEHAVIDMVVNKTPNNSHAISENTYSVKESQKVLNQELDKEITDLKRNTSETSKKDHNENKDATIECDVPILTENQEVDHSVEPKQLTSPIKEDLIGKHLLETQTQKDFEQMEVSAKKESKGREQTRTSLTKDESNIVSNSKATSLNIKSGLLPTPKASTLLSTPKLSSLLAAPKPTSLLPTPKTLSPESAPKTLSPESSPKTSTVLSIPKSLTPANILQRTSLQPVPKSTTPVNTPKTASALCAPKSSTLANTLQKTSLLAVPKSTTPVNTPKTATVYSTPKRSNPVIIPQKTSLLPVPQSTSQLNIPNMPISLSASKANPANSNTSPPSPLLKSSKPSTNINNPEISDASGVAFRPKEKAFIDNTLKQRMQQYLKTTYNIIQLVHRGRFSKILKCSDDKGNEMAVKVMRAKCDRYHMGVLKEQMLKEIQRDIPEENLHFARVHDGFAVGNQWTFLMDYYPKNLKQALEESERPFHINRVQQLSRQLATAVAVLRNNNIVHSDIKPHHLLLNSTNDRLKLCGFDQASYGERKPLPNIGSINYRAPEIILGYSTGFSIDVWSTALVMYEMATKIVLFPGTFNNEILFKQICTLGYVPVDMLRLSQYTYRHFDGTRFMRRGKGHDIIYITADQMYKNNKLLGSLWGVYHSEWGHEASKKQKQQDQTKMHQFSQLLLQMLVIHPKHRLPIEFAYASQFLLEVFT